jgi:hypothetical protein
VHGKLSLSVVISTVGATFSAPWHHHPGCRRIGHPQNYVDHDVGVCSCDRGACAQGCLRVTAEGADPFAASSRTREDALAWCLVWLMEPELSIAAFLA